MMSSAGIYLLILLSLCTIQNLRADRRPVGHRQLRPFDQRIENEGSTITGLKKYIVNGNDSIPNRYPYKVVMIDESGEFYCGGTLIGADIVLTAAHCAVPTWVSVGSHDRNDANDDSRRYEVLYSYRHPRFVGETLEFDMKLLKLRTPADRLPILLNNSPDLPSVIVGSDQNIVTAVGFGKTHVGLQDILQEVELNAITNEDCRQAKDLGSTQMRYRYGYSEKIFDDMLCLTDIENRGRDSCTGDSGGPAILKGNTTEEDVQVGVISWAFGCGSSKFPGVYSRISHSYTWLESSACVMSDQQHLKNFDCNSYFGGLQNNAESGQMVEVVITIRFALYPDRISWSFNDATTYETLVHRPNTEYASVSPGTYSRESISMPAGSNITFSIWAHGTNGLETFSVSFEDNDGNEVIIIEGRGGCDERVDSVTSRPVVLPSRPTSQPSAAPTTEPVVTPSPTPGPTLLSSDPTPVPSKINGIATDSPAAFIDSAIFIDPALLLENQTDSPSSIQSLSPSKRPDKVESSSPTASNFSPSRAPSIFPTQIDSVNSSLTPSPVSNFDDSPTVTPANPLSPLFSFSTTLSPSATSDSPPTKSKDETYLVFSEADLTFGPGSAEKAADPSAFSELNMASSAPFIEGVSFHEMLFLIALPIMATMIFFA